VRSPRTAPDDAGHGWRSRERTSSPPGNAHQRADPFRRDSADFWPAARAAARFSGDVTRHRPQTYDAGSRTVSGHRFSPQDVHTTSQVRGRGRTGHPQVGQVGSAADPTPPGLDSPALTRCCGEAPLSMRVLHGFKSPMNGFLIQPVRVQSGDNRCKR